MTIDLEKLAAETADKLMADAIWKCGVLQTQVNFPNSLDIILAALEQATAAERAELAEVLYLAQACIPDDDDDVPLRVKNANYAAALTVTKRLHESQATLDRVQKLGEDMRTRSCRYCYTDEVADELAAALEVPSAAPPDPAR